MDIEQIKNFLILAEELHFWRTSEKVNITQSALSRQIQSLENELGFPLLIRNQRNVTLTAAGKFLKDKWALELSSMISLHQHAKQIYLGEHGTIRIAHPDSISSSLIPTIVKLITEKYPNLKIELIQLLYENQHEFLYNYKADIVLTRDINKFEGISNVKIAEDTLALVVPDKHPILDVEQITTETLKNEQFILPKLTQETSYIRLIQQMFTHYKLDPKVVLNSEFGSTTVALIRNGLGIAILPNSFQYHDWQGVRFISLPFYSDIVLKWRKENHNPIINNVLQIIFDAYKIER